MAAAAVMTVKVRSSRALAVYAWVVLGALVLVVLWGAVVRATGSGAGCGSRWPLCNGDYWPRHPRLATMIEFTHRSMSGIVTLLVAGLMGWTFYSTGKGHPARKAVTWSGVLLLTEALLGAVLVLRGYVENNVSAGRVVMQSIHFTNTMLLLAAVALTAFFLAPLRAVTNEIVAKSGIRAGAALAVAATMLTGATGSVAALADTLFPAANLRDAMLADFAAGSPLLIRMRWVHPAAALLGLGCVLLLQVRLRSRMSALVMWLACVQIMLGVVDVLLLAPVWMQVIHLLGADVYWIAVVGLAAEVFWPRALSESGELL